MSLRTFQIVSKPSEGLALVAVMFAFLSEECVRHAPEHVIALAPPSVVPEQPITATTQPHATQAIVVAPVLTASTEPAPSLAEELAMIDRARRALADGDSATTKTLVDVYELRYPSGTFSQEADVLRIEALLAQDDMDEAARCVRHFLEVNPNSPHSPRLRELLAHGSVD